MRKSTPIKKFRKKKLPIRMNMIKKIMPFVLNSFEGPYSILVISRELIMISGHPSRLETTKRVAMALPTLSKL